MATRNSSSHSPFADPETRSEDRLPNLPPYHPKCRTRGGSLPAVVAPQLEHSGFPSGTSPEECRLASQSARHERLSQGEAALEIDLLPHPKHRTELQQECSKPLARGRQTGFLQGCARPG